MRFGLFYEHQEPRPWGDGSTERLLADALEQIELADRAGFDSVWEVEHHFLEEYSHSSAPEVFLAAASQRTKRIRLGHGIVQTPPPYNHPARVAERIATLDLVSGGRVELGTGESSPRAELGGFGVDRETRREQGDEALDAITKMMGEGPFARDEDEARAIDKGIDGAHFFGYSLAHYYAFGRHVPGRTDVWEEFERDRADRGFAREIVTAGQEQLGVKLLQQGLGSLRGAVGRPDQVAELVERYEKAGVDQVIFVLQAGRNRHEDICHSIELFAEH